MLDSLRFVRYVRSFMDGRVRVRHPALRDAAIAGKARAALLRVDGVRDIELNPLSGSALILYDSSRLSQDRLIETGCRCKAFGKSVHEFGIDNGDCGYVVRIDTYHFLFVFLVGNHIVDGYLCCCTGGGGQGDDRYRFLFCISYAFERNDIAEFGVVGNNSDRFRCVDGRTSTDSQNKICTRFGKCLHSRFHIGDSRIRFDFTEYFVWNACLLQYL